MKQIETYSYTIATGETLALPAANDNFIILAADGPVTVRGDTFGTLKNLVAGQGLKLVPFNRLELVNTSGAPNTVSILLSPAEFVNQVFSGSVGVTNLAQSVLDDLREPLAQTASYASSGALAAATPDTVFNAAANPNGAILLAAHMQDLSATTLGISVFIAKATAPANINDGAVMLASEAHSFAGSNWMYSGRLDQPMFVPAGMGLYYIGLNATSGGSHARSCRYRIL